MLTMKLMLLFGTPLEYFFNPHLYFYFISFLSHMKCQNLKKKGGAGELSSLLIRVSHSTLGDAMPVQLTPRPRGRVLWFRGRSSAATGGAAAWAALEMHNVSFLFPDIVGALSTSAPQAEQKQRASLTLKSRDQRHGSTSAPAATRVPNIEDTGKFAPVSGRNTASSEARDRRGGKSFRRSLNRIKLVIITGSTEEGRAPLPFVLL